MPNTQKIVESDYPGLYQASDSASKKAQSNYVFIIAINLILMIIAAGISIYDYKSVGSKFAIYVIVGITLLGALILTIITLTKKYEDVWYQGRALAESVKTLTWRYIMCSELFEITLNEGDVQQKFLSRLMDLSKEFSKLNSVMDAKLLNLSPISSLMGEIRNLPISDRKSYYVENRIEDQRNWYAKKAKFNKRKYNLWFGIIIFSQSFSLVFIAYLLVCPDSKWNMVGLFTTFASAALSWLQLKQHQELRQAYTTATFELTYIAELAKQVQNNDDLSKFVLDSENAISREHTLWLAQRRK